MKKIVLIFILILICLLITGCASTNNSTANTDYGMGMIIMPDGSIIKGECSNFVRVSGNWAIITIDGVTYSTNDWRIVRWK